MASDRNGRRISPLDWVMLTPGMSVEGRRRAMVTRIDGEYIMVRVRIDGKPVDAERYGCEMEVQV